MEGEGRAAPAPAPAHAPAPAAAPAAPPQWIGALAELVPDLEVRAQFVDILQTHVFGHDTYRFARVRTHLTRALCGDAAPPPDDDSSDDPDSADGRPLPKKAKKAPQPPPAGLLPRCCTKPSRHPGVERCAGSAREPKGAFRDRPQRSPVPSCVFRARTQRSLRHGCLRRAFRARPQRSPVHIADPTPVLVRALRSHRRPCRQLPSRLARPLGRRGGRAHLPGRAARRSCGKPATAAGCADSLFGGRASRAGVAARQASGGPAARHAPLLCRGAGGGRNGDFRRRGRCDLRCFYVAIYTCCRMLTHALTHTCAYIRAHLHAYDIYAHTYMLTHAHARSHAHTCIHAYAYLRYIRVLTIYTRTHICLRTLTHALTHTHTYMLTHAHAHTHVHTCTRMHARAHLCAGPAGGSSNHRPVVGLPVPDDAAAVRGSGGGGGLYTYYVYTSADGDSVWRPRRFWRPGSAPQRGRPTLFMGSKEPL